MSSDKRDRADPYEGSDKQKFTQFQRANGFETGYLEQWGENGQHWSWVSDPYYSAGKPKILNQQLYDNYLKTKNNSTFNTASNNSYRERGEHKDSSGQNIAPSAGDDSCSLPSGWTKDTIYKGAFAGTTAAACKVSTVATSNAVKGGNVGLAISSGAGAIVTCKAAKDATKDFANHINDPCIREKASSVLDKVSAAHGKTSQVNDPYYEHMPSDRADAISYAAKMGGESSGGNGGDGCDLM